jgi:hypothetical protein
LLSNFTSERAKNQEGLEVSGIHQFLFYADDVNIGTECISNMKKNTEVPLEARRYVSLEVNAGKTKYMFMYCHQNIEKTQFTDC